MSRIMNRQHLNNSGVHFLFLFALLLAACGGASLVRPQDPQGEVIATRALATSSLSTSLPAVQLVTPTGLPLVLASPTLAQPAATLTLSPTITPAATPTADPYASLTVAALASRSYGGGEIQVWETLAENSYFTRSLFSYPSDGLTIYGFMNLPRGEPPFPVVIALHGYINPAIYDTIDYTTRYADALARAGFLVLHPNLRGYPPSDEGENLFRVGMAVDVLNLIALVKDSGGKPGPLEMADSDAIGLWGHSMGGGISTRVITVNPDVRAAVLYGAMSGDEQKNFERIYHYFSGGTRGLEELGVPAEAIQRISPANYLDRIEAAVSIHHGKEDGDVPLAWSLELCQRLKELNKVVDCNTYPGQPHTFHDDGDTLFMQRMIDFYNQYLRTPP